MGGAKVWASEKSGDTILSTTTRKSATVVAHMFKCKTQDGGTARFDYGITFDNGFAGSTRGRWQEEIKAMSPDEQLQCEQQLLKKQKQFDQAIQERAHALLEKRKKKIARMKLASKVPMQSRKRT